MSRLIAKAVSSSTIFAGVFALLGASAPALAQTLSVKLSEPQAGEPLTYAIVSLEDTTGGRHAPSLTDSLGLAVLVAPGPGVYVLRVDRVGTETWRGPSIELRAGETRAVSYTVGVKARPLDAVVIRADQSCDAASAGGAAIASRWDEARKALFAAEHIAAVAPQTMRIVQFERLVDTHGRVEWERVDTATVRSARPFATLHPEALATLGYRIEQDSGVVYYAPDASVLLSNAFARDHCFRVSARPDEPELTGLAFEPSPGRDVVDIAGAFWLDQATGELREVEYRYVNAGRHVDATRAGGRLRFERSSNGSWFIAEWVVRTARVGTIRSLVGRGQVVERTELFGMREEGARSVVVAITGEAGAAGTIAGEVRDESDGSQPLANARVRVVGTPVATVTDTLGQFVAGPLSPGPYTLRVDHRRLRLFRVPAQRDVVVPTGDTVFVTFAVPASATGYGLICDAGGEGDLAARGGIVATVLDRSTGSGVPFAALVAAWRPGFVRRGAEVERVDGGTISANADDAGYAALCALPVAVPIRIRVSAPGFRPADLTVRSRRGRLVERMISLRPCELEDSARVCPAR